MQRQEKGFEAYRICNSGRFQSYFLDSHVIGFSDTNLHTVGYILWNLHKNMGVDIRIF